MADRQLVATGDLALSQVQRQIAGQLSESSKRVYAANIRAFMAFVGNVALWDVRREDVTAYRDHLLTLPISRRTAQSRFAIVMRLFGEAMATPEIAARFPGGMNPVARLRGISVKDSGGTTKHRRIDPADVRAMLEAIPLQRDRLIIYVLLYTGLRRAELHKLTVGSIEAAGAYWRCTVLGKGSKKREIGIPPHVVDEVRAYLATRANVTNDSPLFPALRRNRFSPDWKADETPLSPNMIYEIVRRAGRRIGMANLTAHSTRVTFITSALEAGAPIQDVSLHVGHADVKQTMGYYRSDKLVKESPAYKVRY